jgi:lysophospholipase L1-like esterase
MKRAWIVLAAALWVCSAASAQEAVFSPPKQFIVALGDSLTFGFQQVKFNANPDPANFNTGFVDDFAALVHQTPVGRRAQVVNFGCPGETSASLLAGPCAYHAAGFGLHVNYAGAQIDAATQFIATNSDQVGTILVDIGSNDLLALVRACGGLNLPCIAAGAPAVISTLASNYAQILGRLRAAAPDAEIVVLELYNPFIVIDPRTNAFAPLINGAIDPVARSFGAFTANPFPGIDQTQPEPQTACALTLMCTPLVDIHLSDAGYQFAANLLFTAAGYTRFLHQ